VDLAADRRVKELIRLGDAAIPALIQALESDERLTRSVHFWRDFARSRTVLSVQEARLVAVMSILRVRMFEPGATGDNFTSHGNEVAKEMAGRVRAYWKEYGHLPFDERMMKVLTDPKTSFEAKREAAYNIGHLGEDRTIATTVFSDRRLRERTGPNPAVVKFNNPTAAEAILMALDADLKAHADVEDTYLFPLIELGDKRTAADLRRRSQTADSVWLRRKWAYAAHKLGESEPLKRFADDFRAGHIRLPARDRAVTDDNDQSRSAELLGIVQSLASARLPEADRALDALADPQHPCHGLAAKRVLNERAGWGDSEGWFVHPYCLRILRMALDDTTPTGTTCAIEKDQLVDKGKNSEGSTGVPEFLADPAIRRDKAQERACDTAAKKLRELVVGLPLCHPLFKDADQRLAALKAGFDRFAGRHRQANRNESESLRLSPGSTVYFLDFTILDRAATAEDVKAAKAVFHLAGKGIRADLALPAAAVLKRGENKQDPPPVLIVQAEVGPDGQVTYGVIMKDDIRAVPGRELTNIKPFEERDNETEK
jgi:hypothetical protein